MSDKGNKKLRLSHTYTQYVILVERDGILKGIANCMWSRKHIDCTVLPHKMLKFKNKERALEYWENNKWRDKELTFNKIAKLVIGFSLKE